MDSLRDKDIFFFNLVIDLFFGLTCSLWQFPHQGLSPRHISDPSLHSDNTGSLTRGTTRELPTKTLLKSLLSVAKTLWENLEARGLAAGSQKCGEQLWGEWLHAPWPPRGRAAPPLAGLLSDLEEMLCEGCGPCLPRPGAVTSTGVTPRGT